jgi:zinc/manganese transport system ATP-binding protein
VLRSDVLSDLYETPVDVIRSHGRVFVAGIPNGHGDDSHHHHEDPQ